LKKNLISQDLHQTLKNKKLINNNKSLLMIMIKTDINIWHPLINKKINIYLQL
jgi:hypothetical protein